MNSLGDYGSDSDSGDDTPKTTKQKSALSSILPPPGTTKSSFALPPPTKSGGLSLPPPKAKGKKKEPIRFIVEKVAREEDGAEDERSAKKPRLDGDRKGAGSSSLLAMLPAPKKRAAEIAPPPPPPRVLGSAAGGGDAGIVVDDSLDLTPIIPSTQPDDSHLSFLPAHLRQPRNKAVLPTPTVQPPAPVIAPPPKQKEEEGTDFFSIVSKPRPSAISSLPSSSLPSRPLTSISAAPKIKEYEPPEPTPFDPYPGYYQLPSGTWVAHDPTYYEKYWRTWQPAQPDNSGKSKDGRGWEGADADGVTSIDASEEMLKEKLAEREKQKNITAAPVIAQPAMPNMKIKNLGGRARSRHQLSTLLTEAYSNREAIEEQIAAGRRNQKEAGRKYGF